MQISIRNGLRLCWMPTELRTLHQPLSITTLMALENNSCSVVMAHKGLPVHQPSDHRSNPKSYVGASFYRGLLERGEAMLRGLKHTSALISNSRSLCFMQMPMGFQPPSLSLSRWLSLE